MTTNNAWNNQVLDADVTFNGGTVSIGTDATSGAINIGTGAAARTTTIGNTTGASALALKCGTGDFSLASASGTLISALDTGAVTKPLQPAFSAYRSSTASNVTGNGTLYHVIFNSEFYDIGGNYNTGTGNFTAPVDGIYLFRASVELGGIVAIGYLYLKFNSSSTQTKQIIYCKPVTGISLAYEICGIMKLSAGDTVYVSVQSYGEAGDVEEVNGDANGIVTNFAGILLA
jgi:hypothetical protein